MGDLIRVAGKCSPKITKVAVGIIHGLGLLWIRTPEKNRTTAKERLYIIRDIAESRPNRDGIPWTYRRTTGKALLNS